MSVKITAAKSAATLLTVAGVALAASGCGHSPASQARAANGSGPDSGRATLTAVLDPGGHAWAAAGGGAVLVSSDAGRQWRTVRLPGRPAIGHSVVVSGSVIAAVVTEGGGLAYERSSDAGATWHKIAVPTPAPTDQASLALSGDGREVAVMAVLPGSAGAGDLPELATGPVRGPLSAARAPVSGYVAWSGSRLVLTGGPLQSQLYTSGDLGRTWTQHPVDGPAAPRFNVPPGTPSLGVPMPGPGTSVTVPVTEHLRGGAAVRLFTSPDGVHYIPGPRIALPGAPGPGVTAPASPAGPGRYVLASPAGTRLYLVTGRTLTTITPSGLAGTIDSLTFASPRDGLAETTLNSCAGKQNCHSATRLYQTSDGGHTWQRSAAG
jgi:photosystem II stability/assembly factor-like uncharacterized protein